MRNTGTAGKGCNHYISWNLCLPLSTCLNEANHFDHLTCGQQVESSDIFMKGENESVNRIAADMSFLLELREFAVAILLC